MTKLRKTSNKMVDLLSGNGLAILVLFEKLLMKKKFFDDKTIVVSKLCGKSY